MSKTIADGFEQEWLNPSSIYRSAPFWSWNDRLEPARLTRQIEQMREAGMGGFFMHSRFGLKTPYLSPEWFECVKACVDKARQLGMKAYLYDEDRWPSGSAGGLVTRTHPEFGLHLLGLVRGHPVSGGLDKQANFAAVFDAQGQSQSYRLLEEGEAPAAGEELLSCGAGVAEKSDWYNEAPYVDTMNPRAIAEFIRLTHQAYADRFSADMPETVPAIFTDEPNFFHGKLAEPDVVAWVPWTPELPREFLKRRGYDLRRHLPELFHQVGAQAFSKVRHDYRRTITELYVEAFSQQIGRWCERHNIASTGHYLCEETFDLQTQYIGSAMPHYEHQQWPGIDILCDQINEYNTAKQCSSVAAQMGHERVLSELYGCTGWDWPLEGHKFNAGWQYVLGVNLRCPHLSWYSMAGGAKRDYPASIFPHSPWWKYYRTVEDYFGRLSVMLTQGKPVRDVLVLHTIESAWGTFVQGPKQGELNQALWQGYNELLKTLLEQHFDFDLGDESILARHGKASGGKLKVNKMEYRLVVVPPALTLRASTVALLRRFQAGGGTVVFVGQTPEMVDAAPAPDALAELVEQAVRCGAEPTVVGATLEDLLPRRVSVTEQGRQAPFVWAMLRQLKSAANRPTGRLLFLQSIDRQAGHTVRVSVQGRKPVVLWDAQTGRRIAMTAEAAGDRVEFELHLPPTGSALLSLGQKVEADGAEPPQRPLESHELPGPWEIELAEDNSFPLDFCRLKLGDAAPSEPLPVLEADHKVREHFGLPRRSAGGQQPWFLAQTGRADRTPRGRCEMRFAFHVSVRPARLALAIERPEDFEVSLNGRRIDSTPAGSWVDPDIKTLDLTAAVAEGDNELVLAFDYRSDMELEDLHLVGAFGVRQTRPERVLGAWTLVEPPTRLSPGSWVGQGLDFYGGAVRYRAKLHPSVWQAVSAMRRVRLRLPGVKGACFALHIGDRSYVLPWEPLEADITDALVTQAPAPCDEVVVEVIGGRHNIFGPLHVPWLRWTGPGEFQREHKQWTDQYLLNDHGLLQPPVIEIVD